MKGQMELFSEEKDDRERIEPEAAEVSREFEWFCGFLLQEKIKLSKNTGYIGKKDCFALNERADKIYRALCRRPLNFYAARLVRR